MRKVGFARAGRALLLVAVLALGVAGIAGWLLFGDLPSVEALPQRLVRPTTQILDRNGRLLYEVIDPNAGKQLSLSLETIPQACINATIATEDKRFYSHPGFDPIAIGRALYQNFRADGAIMSGGSTITQQVARNTLLDVNERFTQSVQRKLREAWLAVQIESVYSKDEILALYLNQTYYGNFAFGLEAAANIFFAKPAAQLSQGECALLAGIVQYPTGYNPLVAPEVAKARQLTVLRLMRDTGMIDQAQQVAIAAEPLRYKTTLFAIEAPHFVMYVQDLLNQRVGVDALRTGGLTVRTSLDLDLQRKLEESVNYHLDMLNCRIPGKCNALTDPNRKVQNAAAIVLDQKTGDILAMVGSPNYFDASIQGNVNAALALRQPGSAIKPLTYAAALDPTWAANAGVTVETPATILADLPTTFYVADSTGANVPYAPVNYDRKSHGPVSVRTALANSYNIPAVLTLDRIGVPTLQQIAAQTGISSFGGNFGLALTLGGGEVRLLELTAAYGMLDDGKRLDPRAILAINGTPAAQGGGALGGAALGAAPSAQQVISPQSAWLITDILDDDTARIPAFGNTSPLSLPFEAAAKTGTTTDWRDNWTLGYTTERVVGVWVGNADNSPMIDVSGVDGAGPIWHDAMRAAHTNAPPPFERPSGIVDVNICAPSGMLASEACPRTRVEHFIQGTEPTETDDEFVTLAVSRSTGEVIQGYAPKAKESVNAALPDGATWRTFWDLPVQYRDWAIAEGVALLPPSVASASASASAHATNAPLVLTAPSSNGAYRIAPGVPADTQQIAVRGHAPGGTPWAELRLVVIDALGTRVLESASNTSQIDGWYTLEEGDHTFVLEGERTEGGTTEQSSRALIQVQPYATAGAP